MPFTPPQRGPTSFPKRVALSLAIGAILMSIWMGMALAFRFSLHWDLFPWKLSQPIFWRWSRRISDSSFLELVSSFTLFAGIVYGWFLAKADECKWRFHLWVIQCGSFILSSVCTAAAVLMMWKFFGALPHYIAWLNHHWPAPLMFISVVAVGPCGLGWMIFLTAFWWRKELDFSALAAGNTLRDRPRLRVLSNSARTGPHMGQLISQIFVAAFVVTAFCAVVYFILDRTEWGIERYLDSSTYVARTELPAGMPTVELEITKSGRVCCNGKIIGAAADQKLSAVADLLATNAQAGADVALIIRVAPNVRHQRLIEVMSAAQRADVDAFCLLSLSE